MRTSPLCSGWRDSRRLVSVSWKRMSSGFGVGTEFSILAEGLGGRQLRGWVGFLRSGRGAEARLGWGGLGGGDSERPTTSSGFVGATGGGGICGLGERIDIAAG